MRLNLGKAKFFSLDLGLGWAPAILDSKGELDFIKQAQKELSDISNYWIGGFTKVTKGRMIQFSQYRPTRFGNYM